jgi:hypothetical protein
MGAQAKKTGSFSFGTQTISDGEFAFASGYKTTSSGFYSTSMGAYTTASGQGSTSMGMYSVASGYMAVAGGYWSKAIGSFSTAMGYSQASGYGSTAMGTFSKASGPSSTAMGNFTKATQHGSTAFGSSTESLGFCSTSMGYYTIARPAMSLVIGEYNDTTWSSDCAMYENLEDPIFIIGNGYGIHQRSNALTVLRNGCIGLNSIVSPTYALELPNNWSQSKGTGIAYAWTTYSDSRVKENQDSLVYGLKEIMVLLPKQYIQHNSYDQATWLNDNAPKSIGLVAQDVYNVIPEAVIKPEDEEIALWSMSYDKLIPVMVNAIKEQQKQIESYKSQLQSLQQEVEQIKAFLATSGGK